MKHVSKGSLWFSLSCTERFRRCAYCKSDWAITLPVPSGFVKRDFGFSAHPCVCHDMFRSWVGSTRLGFESCRS